MLLFAGLPIINGQLSRYSQHCRLESLAQKALVEDAPLKEPSKDAPLPEGKNRREPQPPLSLTDDVGNFATPRGRGQSPGTSVTSRDKVDRGRPHPPWSLHDIGGRDKKLRETARRRKSMSFEWNGDNCAPDAATEGHRSRGC